MTKVTIHGVPDLEKITEACKKYVKSGEVRNAVQTSD